MSRKKLDDLQVAEIRATAARGDAPWGWQTELAKKWGVPQTLISRYANGALRSGEPGRESRRFKKLSPEKVASIRNSTERGSELARRYGVSRARVSQIKNAKPKPDDTFFVEPTLDSTFFTSQRRHTEPGSPSVAHSDFIRAPSMARLMAGR